MGYYGNHASIYAIFLSDAAEYCDHNARSRYRTLACTTNASRPIICERTYANISLLEVFSPNSLCNLSNDYGFSDKLLNAENYLPIFS